jgi:hypothetical protein
MVATTRSRELSWVPGFLIVLPISLIWIALALISGADEETD